MPVHVFRVPGHGWITTDSTCFSVSVSRKKVSKASKARKLAEKGMRSLLSGDTSVVGTPLARIDLTLTPGALNHLIHTHAREWMRVKPLLEESHRDSPGITSSIVVDEAHAYLQTGIGRHELRTILGNTVFVTSPLDPVWNGGVRINLSLASGLHEHAMRIDQGGTLDVHFMETDKGRKLIPSMILRRNNGLDRILGGLATMQHMGRMVAFPNNIRSHLDRICGGRIPATDSRAGTLLRIALHEMDGGTLTDDERMGPFLVTDMEPIEGQRILSDPVSRMVAVERPPGFSATVHSPAGTARVSWLDDEKEWVIDSFSSPGSVMPAYSHGTGSRSRDVGLKTPADPAVIRALDVKRGEVA